MNLVGKIFVSLIAVMSIIFFSLTLVLYASHKNWKGVADEKNAEIKTLNDEKSELSRQKADLEETISREKAGYEKVSGALKTKADELETENGKLTEEKAALEAESQKRQEIITTNNATIREYQLNIETLMKDLATAQKNRADYLQSLVTTVNQMHELASVRGDLEEKNKELAVDFDKAKAVLDMKGLTATPELYDRTLPFPVSGIVQAVQEGPKGLIMVSLGSDDGLRPQHTLEVTRDNSYLGRIEVITVEPNRAVCRILPEYRQGTILEGDKVVSKLEEN